MDTIEAQFTALREFALNGTDHATHREQNSMIRHYIAWRNRHTGNPRLRQIIDRANIAGHGTSSSRRRLVRGRVLIHVKSDCALFTHSYT